MNSPKKQKLEPEEKEEEEDEDELTWEDACAEQIEAVNTVNKGRTLVALLAALQKKADDKLLSIEVEAGQTGVRVVKTSHQENQDIGENLNSRTVIAELTVGPHRSPINMTFYVHATDAYDAIRISLDENLRIEGNGLMGDKS